MEWPQWVYIGLTFMGLGLELARHGQRKTGEHNFISQIIATAIIYWLLWAGGFFS